jgi:hypothetical protein
VVLFALCGQAFAQGIQPVNPLSPSGSRLFPNAFASADNIAAQTATFMHGGLMGWDSSGGNWDRLQISAGGRLLVDGSGVTQPVSVSNTISIVSFVEDDPAGGHNAGELYVIGAVRQDTASTTTSTDGDYTNLKTDSAGRLRVTAADTTQPVSGTVSISGSVTVTDGAGALNVICDSGCGGGTQYAEDTAHSSGDQLMMAGVVQQSADTALAGDGDRTALQVDANGYLKVNIKAGAGSGGTAATDNSAFTGGSTSVTPMGAIYDTTPPAITDGNVGAPRMNSSRQLMVDCVAGCSGSSFADNSAFTFGTTPVSPIAGVLDDTATNTATENSAAVARITAQKALHTNLRNNSGTEIGTASNPIRTSATSEVLNVLTSYGPGGTSIASNGATAELTFASDQTGASAVMVSLTGTWSGTLQFEVLPSGSSSNWQPVKLHNATDAVTSTTANGIFMGGVAGADKFRVRSSAWSSGTVTIEGAVTRTTPGVITTNPLPTGTNTIGGVNLPQYTPVSGRLPVDGSGVTQPVSGTVTANVGTFPDNEPFNVAQINGVAPSMGNGASGTGVLRVTVASDSTGQLNVLGTLADDGAAAGTNRVGTLPAIAQSGMNSATAGRNTALNTSSGSGNLLAAFVPESGLPSYSASAVVSSAASATDIAILNGNATNTVLLTEIRVSCTQSTAGIVQLHIIKRSTANSGGTSSGMTEVPDDSAYSAASSAGLTYTANPTPGTTVGDLDVVKLGCMATGTAAPNDIYIANFRQKPIVLRGTAQGVAVNLNGATVSGGSFAITYKWLEVTGL